MPTRKPYLIAAGLWLVMVVVFFCPVLFQGKVLAPLDIMDSLLRPWATTGKIEVHNAFTYDAISQYLPYDYSVYQSLQQDGYIGWNPYTHSGSSIVENTMICPGDWHHHLYRFLPFWAAWNTGIILQFTLAGLGMLLLLRDQKIPASHALIGVVAFAFYSQFILWIEHRWVLGAMCWAPWIVWALLRAKQKSRVIDLVSIIFIALAFRGGHLQTCIFVVLLVILLAIADWWGTEHRLAPKSIFKTFLPYALCGIFGAILSLDVIAETVPALLYGKRELSSRSWLEAITALPTLITSVFPTLLGTPQGLDLNKFFKTDLFSLKFMGAVPLLLASLACFQRQAPATAKTFFVVGLLLPFTPADQWLYSRFTVIFALGGSWLAAWYLTTLSQKPPTRIWKYASLTLLTVAGLWLIGSLVITAKQAWVETKLHEIVLANLPPDKIIRTEWMLFRADVFLRESMFWAPRNLTMMALIGLGIFACSHIHNQHRLAHRFAVLAALCAFGEMLLFSSTWLTFSKTPEGDGLYHEPAWAKQLKQEVGSGSILCYDRSDFDYMQLNTPSVYGIRFAEGYETVTPKRINPYLDPPFDPQRCADSGISHILASPLQAPTAIEGWEKTIETKEFVLFKNPIFQGIASASLTDGTHLPVTVGFTSPNRREIPLPAKAKSIQLLESFNPGWKYSTDGKSWQPVQESQIHGIRIELANSTQSEPKRLLLQYRPIYQSYYRSVIGLTLAGLIGLSFIQRSKAGFQR